MSVDAPSEENLPPGFWQAVGLDERRRLQLEAFRTMLAAANETMNLVGPSTLPAFWTRHVLDSAQLLWWEREATTWADLGAGAGFPGVVLAILLQGREGARVELIDSMAKRCRFLQSVVDMLGLPARVHNARAEDLRLRVEAATARACAPLDRLLGYAEPYMRLGARAWLLKGSDVDKEITAARAHWRFDGRCETSLSDPRGRLLAIRSLSRVSRR